MATAKSSEVVLVKAPEIQGLKVEIEGITPLVTHAWDEKAIEMMRAKQQGKGKKLRQAKDPEEDFNAARYRLTDGSDGIPVTAVKAAMISAAHRDLGVPRTVIRQAVFLEADEGLLLRLNIPSEPKMREDLVRVGMGTADLRYRPEYAEWGLTLRFQYQADQIAKETIINLLERAGFGIGLGEWRPEKGGDWGRFRVVRGA